MDMFNSFVCLPEGTQVSLTQSFNTHNMGLAQTPEIGWFIEMINLVLPVAPHLRKSSPYPCIQQSASSLIHASKDSEIQGFVMEISTHHGGKHPKIRTWGASITCTRSTFQAASGQVASTWERCTYGSTKEDANWVKISIFWLDLHPHLVCLPARVIRTPHP
jgi:hypothetical protein